MLRDTMHISRPSGQTPFSPAMEGVPVCMYVLNQKQISILKITEPQLVRTGVGDLITFLASTKWREDTKTGADPTRHPYDNKNRDRQQLAGVEHIQELWHASYLLGLISLIPVNIF
jgi:hypothetical protein